jgi:YVTN family beta-propeller protein
MRRLLVSPLLALFLLALPLAAGPAGTLVVLNKSDASAWLVDPESGARLASVPTGDGPHEADVTADGRLAVVTNYGTSKAPGSTLTLIDLAEGKAAGTIDLGEHRRPHGVQVLPDGKRAVVTAETSQALLVVDLTQRKVLSAIPTGEKVSHMVALSPDGKTAFVSSIGSGTVTAIDLAMGEKTRTVKTGEGAEGIAVTPDGKEVWVGNRASDTLTVLDPSTLEAKRTIPCAQFPIRLEISLDGTTLLASNARSGDVAVFDAKDGRELRRVKMPMAAATTEGRLFADRFGKSPVPIGLLVPPAGKVAFVANSNADAVVVFDLSTGAILRTLPTGAEPDGLAWTPLRPKASTAAKP